jgi:hypothetical protein
MMEGRIMETNDTKPEIPPFVKTGRSLLENDITEIPMLWGHLLHKYGIAVLGGSSDTGKSSLLRQLSAAIVNKESEFLGYPLNLTYNSVIIVSSEDDEYSMSSIIKRENLSGYSNENYDNLRFIFDTSNIHEKLIIELKRQPVDCIIIDALGDFITGEMNAANNVRGFYDFFNSIAKAFKCLVIFLHHTRKSASDITPSKYDLLGSQGFEAKPRSVLMLSIDEKDDNVRYLTLVKGNYTSTENKKNAIVLKTNDKFVFEFSEVVKNIVDRTKPNPSKITLEVAKRIIELRNGLIKHSISQITEILKKEGFDISRGTVGTFVKKIDENSDCRPTSNLL